MTVNMATAVMIIRMPRRVCGRARETLLIDAGIEVFSSRQTHYSRVGASLLANSGIRGSEHARKQIPRIAVGASLPANSGISEQARSYKTLRFLQKQRAAPGKTRVRAQHL